LCLRERKNGRCEGGKNSRKMGECENESGERRKRELQKVKEEVVCSEKEKDIVVNAGAKLVVAPSETGAGEGKVKGAESIMGVSVEVPIKKEYFSIPDNVICMSTGLTMRIRNCVGVPIFQQTLIDDGFENVKVIPLGGDRVFYINMVGLI